MAWYFNGTNPEESLYEEALFWSGGTSTTFPVDPDFTRLFNFAVDRIVAAIQKSDKTWSYNDNNLDAEIIDGTTTLSANVNKYEISLSWLKIARVRVKDRNGNLITLRSVQRRQLSDSQLNETGVPWGYYKLGEYLYLVGTPDYGFANGIEVQFQTGPEHFVVGDTTKSPGFASQFHRLPAFLAALEWCEANEMEARARVLRSKVGVEPDPLSNEPGSGMFREMVTYYTQRDDDGAPSMSLRREDYGAGSLGGDSSVLDSHQIS